MIYNLRKQCIDVIFMLMLILSTGGLLFVFNRNIVSAFFLLFILFTLIFMEAKWKKTIVNAMLGNEKDLKPMKLASSWRCDS